MKFFATLTLLLSLALSGFAQPEVTSAFMLNKDGEFEKAAVEIDKATTNPKANIKEKTWRYRGMIYYNIALDSTLTTKFPEAMATSAESFLKANELDVKGKYTQDNSDYLSTLQNLALNRGVEFYNQSDFAGAAKNFDMSASIASKFGVTDTLAIFNGALSHEKAGNSQAAIDGYLKCADLGYNVPNVYQFASNIYKEQADTTKSIELIRIAREKFPRDQNLIIEELNFYLSRGDMEKAMENLKIAAELDPNNEVLHYNMGVVLDNNKQYDEAEEAYKKALAINPDYFDANYNIGALFFNQGVEMVNTAREIRDNAKYEAAMKEADDVFTTGLPYLEKAREINPDDVQTLRSLRDIYVRVGEDDKFLQVQKKLKELGAG